MQADRTQVVQGLHFPATDTHFAVNIGRSRQIDGGPTYQLGKLERALAHVRRFDLALDIGAHVGLWSRVLATRFAHVIAFEPLPIHQTCFRLNVRRANVELRPMGLGSRAETLRFESDAHNTGHTFVSRKDAGVAAPVMPLDALAVPYPDFIKIDVEGWEREVLLGGEALIRRARPVMIVEQKHAAYGLDRLAAVTLLQEWGYAVVDEMAHDYILVAR